MNSRKSYVAPRQCLVALDAALQMMATSNLPVGGKTDHFDTPHKIRNDENSDWSDHNDN